MSMFDTVKGLVSKTAKDAVKVSNTAVEYTKLKFKLAETKDAINEKYIAIGKLVYSTSLGEEVDSDDIENICKELGELFEKSEEYEDALNKASNKKQCPECGSKVPGGSQFCPQCGNKLDEE